MEVAAAKLFSPFDVGTQQSQCTNMIHSFGPETFFACLYEFLKFVTDLSKCAAIRRESGHLYSSQQLKHKQRNGAGIKNQTDENQQTDQPHTGGTSTTSHEHLHSKVYVRGKGLTETNKSHTKVALDQPCQSSQWHALLICQCPKTF